MRIATYTVTGTETYTDLVHHDAELAEDGTVTVEAYDEEVIHERPVMGMVYRDATDEEVAAWEAETASMPEPEPTVEERLDELTNDKRLKLFLESISVETNEDAPVTENGTEPVEKYDAKTNSIIWSSEPYRHGDGTTTSPKQFIDGDEVTEGTYYAYYRKLKNGVYAAQQTSGVGLCIKSGVAEKLVAGEFFEVKYIW